MSKFVCKVSEEEDESHGSGHRQREAEPEQSVHVTRSGRNGHKTIVVITNQLCVMHVMCAMGTKLFMFFLSRIQNRQQNVSIISDKKCAIIHYKGCMYNFNLGLPGIDTKNSNPSFGNGCIEKLMFWSMMNPR